MSEERETQTDIYIKRLENALETAAYRFEKKKFGCDWQDAADDCRRVIWHLARVRRARG